MEQCNEIKVSISLILPASVGTDKEKIAEYLNKMLYEDPEFFGDFGPENIENVEPF